MGLFSKNIHRNIYLFSLMLTAVSLPFSRFGMSVSILVLTVNWLLEGNLIEKFKSFFKNRAALVFTSLFLIHIIWLLNTSNFNYAIDDLRTKIPILAFGVILPTSGTISNKEFWRILKLHISAVLVAVFIGFFIFFTKEINEIRQISPFISHIRLSLNVCMAFFSVLYLILKSEKTNRIEKSALIILDIIFFLFVLTLQSLTGLVLVWVVLFLLLIHYIIKHKIKIVLKISLFLILIIVPILSILYFYKTVNGYIKPYQYSVEELNDTSYFGNTYTHDTILLPVENGYWIGQYIILDELEEAWNKRSNIDFYSYDYKNQDVRITLIRYLNSKGSRKDYKAVEALSDKEIQDIENGIANINYTEGFGFKVRLFKIIWEYQNYKLNGGVEGHSIIQRIELWRLSKDLIKQNWLWGCGTGDVPTVFKEEMIKQDSPLKESRMRSHNQYFSILITFGIFGFIWFIFILLYPFLFLGKQFDYFYVVFFIIFVLSMLVEDTIESQEGLTFFVFFNTLFLFLRPQNSSHARKRN